MKKIAIVTDSNSGIPQKEAQDLGVYVLSMPFFINGEEFFEDITLTQEEFYQKLDDNADISTSMPSPGSVTDLWNSLLERYDEIVHIPMSSGLSGTCEAAIGLSKDFAGRVQVVDNQRISILQEQATLDAVTLKKAGKSAAEIKDILEEEKRNCSVYVTVDTLKYLKKGGRITPAAAALGSVLNIKPILTLNEEKLDAFAKARGLKSAKRTMLDAIAKDLNQRFISFEGEMELQIAHTTTPDQVEQWTKEVREAFPQFDHILVRPLSLSVACHTGPGALAVGLSRRL